MGRPLRNDPPGTWFHVFNRGAARQTIFHDDRDRVDFERLLGVAHDRFGLEVHSYCLMGNHYHLLVSLADGGLSDAMHAIGSSFVRHVNERSGRDGPLFRSRFSAKSVGDDEYAIRLVRYVHRNPLAFLPEELLTTYRWSSLRAFTGSRRPPRWLTTTRVLDLLGGVRGFEDVVLGDGVRRRRSVAIDHWLDAIDLVLDERFDEVRQGLPRTVAALALDQLDGDRRCELAELLAFPTNQAERSALSRARRRAVEMPELRAAVTEVLRFVA